MVLARPGHVDDERALRAHAAQEAARRQRPDLERLRLERHRQVAAAITFITLE